MRLEEDALPIKTCQTAPTPSPRETVLARECRRDSRATAFRHVPGGVRGGAGALRSGLVRVVLVIRFDC
ncbi:MAG: hypothetical protein JWM27_1033 [Gemmatimonadetes bacterium]|nr:hypothetical protein [Gemmatimonadota bacterium]